MARPWGEAAPSLQLYSHHHQAPEPWICTSFHLFSLHMYLFFYHSLDCVDRCRVFVFSLIMFMQLYIRSAPRFKIPHLCNLWYLGIFVAQVAMHCPRKVKHFALEKCVYIFADNWGVALEELNSPKSVPKWKQSATEAARNAGNIPSQSQLINVVVHGIFGCRKLLTNIMPVYPAPFGNVNILRASSAMHLRCRRQRPTL